MATDATAVMFLSIGDTNYNTTPPTGTLAGSGWDYQGDWLEFSGTPIAPRYFITAKHVNGSTNNIFTFNGLAYHPVMSFSTIDADLRIWKVKETFPIYAPLYTASAESNQHVVVFGRGTQRDGPVIISGATNGWFWGAEDGVRRWGENDIGVILPGGFGVGDLLRASFDRTGPSNECHLSTGDSGGGMFIQDAGVWKLAGIHRAVDGMYSNPATAGTFSAALVDRGGLFQQDGFDWLFITNTVADNPSGFYSSRISGNLAWINSIIDFEPGDDLKVASVRVIGNDVQVNFLSGSNRLYKAERRDNIVSGVWTTFTNNVPGTGGLVPVIDTGAASLPARFYRIGFAP